MTAPKDGRRRNWRGQFVRELTPTPEEVRCWLIWSRKWNLWHRRSADGGACGYTDSIAEAGLFPFSKANAYHDGWDNEAFHVRDKIALIEWDVAERGQQIELLNAKLAQVAS
jgi:hypothetical protein